LDNGGLTVVTGCRQGGGTLPATRGRVHLVGGVSGGGVVLLDEDGGGACGGCWWRIRRQLGAEEDGVMEVRIQFGTLGRS